MPKYLVLLGALRATAEAALQHARPGMHWHARLVQPRAPLLRACAADKDVDWDAALRDLNESRRQPRVTPSPVGAGSVAPVRPPPNLDLNNVLRQLLLEFVVAQRAGAIQAAQDALRSRSAGRQEELRQRSYIAPRDSWTLEDIAQYDGVAYPDGPILMAADGSVFNVGGPGAKFYAPGISQSKEPGKLILTTIICE